MKPAAYWVEVIEREFLKHDTPMWGGLRNAIARTVEQVQEDAGQMLPHQRRLLSEEVAAAPLSLPPGVMLHQYLSGDEAAQQALAEGRRREAARAFAPSRRFARAIVEAGDRQVAITDQRGCPWCLKTNGRHTSECITHEARKVLDG